MVTIPDGGVLPGPNPVSTVIAADGTEIPSYCLYYTRKYGMVVLFEQPRVAQSVYIYIQSGAQMNVYTPDSGLTPSMLLYTRKGQNSLSAARHIKAGKLHDRVQFMRHRWVKDNPLQISCDVTAQGMYGRGSAYSARLTGYLMTTDPGRTWVSAFSIYQGKKSPVQQGMEVYIDGNRVTADTRLSGKSCGQGQWMDLSKGIHKIDVYHATDPVREGFGALVVTWRTPNTTPGELGGLREKDLPHPNTPMWEARPLRENEIVRSGTCVVKTVEERKGAPVASFEARPLEIFWLSDESQPLLVYEFEAVTSGNPEDTRYTWQPGGDAKIEGRERITWLLPGYKESSMTLTVASGSRKSTVTLPFFAFRPGLSSDLNIPSTRQAFRNVCLDMLRAYPSNSDPTGEWDSTRWALLFTSLEFGSSRPLLAQIFSHNWDSMRKRIDPTNRFRIEDAFYEWFSFKDPERCLRWLKKIEKNEAVAERRKELRLMQAEILMYLLKDFDAARKLASDATGGRDDVSAIATVRMGDIEFLKGNINEAIRFYGEVQSQSKAAGHVETDSSALQWSAPPRWKANAGAAKARTRSTGRKDRVDDWKKGAVLDTSASETAKTLLEQGYYEEARNVLVRWERLFPLSKLTGDYIIHQADLYMKLENYKRARALLEAYCEHVEASSYIVPAVDMLLECMRKTGATRSEVETFARKMKKRLEFHPIAERMDYLLDRLKSHGSER